LGIALVVAGYFLVLGLLLAATEIFGLKLRGGAFMFSGPTRWKLLLDAVYYLGPLVAGLVAGFAFRPFVPHLVAVLVAVFLMHGIYSVTVTVLRLGYLQTWQEEHRQSRHGVVVLEAFKYELGDADEDGLIDGITLQGALATQGLPAGNYDLLVVLSRTGGELARHVVANRDFTVVATDPESVGLEIEFDPRRFRADFAAGIVSVDIEVRRYFRPSRYGRAVLRLCGWAAFFCPSYRDGSDASIYEDIKEVNLLKSVERLRVPVERIQRKQVTFLRFLGDEGRDEDGDGRFEAIGVAVEVDSIYAGPIYLQAHLVDAPRPSLSHTTRLGKGVRQLEFLVPGERLKEMGRDGPYRLKAFVFLNNDPYCPGGKCATVNRPPFTVYLPEYETEAYRLDRFE
jgi:hypothetical protein